MSVTIDDLQDRTETDLADEELTRILAKNVKAVERSAGSADSEKENFIDSLGAVNLVLTRRHTSITSIVERTKHSSDPVTLSATDYREIGDYMIRRLADGDNPASYWGAQATVTYVPEVDSDTRDEIALQLSILDIEFRAFESEKSGDWQGSQKDWKARRRELLAQVREGRSPIT